jgi:hypothetical protein
MVYQGVYTGRYTHGFGEDSRGRTLVTAAQREYTEDELLADRPTVEPLRTNGLVCHGGFDAAGTYVSPRTEHRIPAIQAWQEHHREDFGTEILDAPLSAWPGSYPNVEQARYLLQEGVREPIVASLTRIGTVEGFGARIRYLAPPDIQRFFVEDVRGTAMAHLSRGLVEAHARDEAGWGNQAGHDRMWFAVRDMAFENPVTEDQTNVMLERMGLRRSAGDGSSRGQSAPPTVERLWADLDLGLEMLVGTMTRVLFIEIKAFHIFAWAESLLSDFELVAGDGEAARIVSYIRADETPHVDYLRTALTEMRDRTFIGESGRRRAGTEVIGRIWDCLLQESMGRIEEQNRARMRREVELAVSNHLRSSEILERFDSLAG